MSACEHVTFKFHFDIQFQMFNFVKTHVCTGRLPNCYTVELECYTVELEPVYYGHFGLSIGTYVDFQVSLHNKGLFETVTG